MFKSFVNIQELEVTTAQHLEPGFSTHLITAEDPLWPDATGHNQFQCTCQCNTHSGPLSQRTMWDLPENINQTHYTEPQWAKDATASFAVTGYPSPVASPTCETYIHASSNLAKGEFDYYSKPNLSHYGMLKLEELQGLTNYAHHVTDGTAYGSLIATPDAFEDMTRAQIHNDEDPTTPGLIPAMASPALTDKDMLQESPSCEFLIYQGDNSLFKSSPPPPTGRQLIPETHNRKTCLKSTKSQPSTYKCDYPHCTATFTRPYNLKSHKRTHTNERPYACSHEGCNKTFARHHDRNRHAKLHMGLKPYSCPHCKKCFARQDALIRHSKIENAPCSQVVQAKKVPLKFKFLNGR
ncbi:hypothetical protein NQZ79_g5958 [Umbelopsis isabellina]|nr:hypothetical protein NQZ79_g5958 [Umbelopsis isabellina]